MNSGGNLTCHSLCYHLVAISELVDCEGNPYQRNPSAQAEGEYLASKIVQMYGEWQGRAESFMTITILGAGYRM